MVFSPSYGNCQLLYRVFLLFLLSDLLDLVFSDVLLRIVSDCILVLFHVLAFFCVA